MPDTPTPDDEQRADAHPRRLPIEPWQVREVGIDLDRLRDMESIFALANGSLGVRGGLDEGQPRGVPGTYLNSFFEEHELTYPERSYGAPERTQTLVGAPEGTRVRLFVDDDPLDVRTGDIHEHERTLDLREGTLRRQVAWTSPRGGRVRVRSVRLVPLDRPDLLAIEYEATALDGPVRVRLHSDLTANPDLPDESESDPRAAALVEAPLVGLAYSGTATGGVLVHRTRHSGQRVAAAVDHAVAAGVPARQHVEIGPDRIRVVVEADLPADGRLRLTKLVGYAWTGGGPTGDAGDGPTGDAGDGPTGDAGDGSAGAPDQLCDAALAAVAAARQQGWRSLLANQRAHLDRFWDDVDLDIDGDDEIRQGVRFGLFHILQASARTGDRPIGAKGLTGTGYEGHTLWDTEMYVLPVLTYLRPAAARGALRWRHATLDQARERARELRLAGAAFPWRTIGGPECSGYWPAGSAALHINADIAAAVLRYAAATGDDEFVRGVGLELLVETARLWWRVGHFDDAGRFHIDGVTGPDEYTALGNDNLFTNVVARLNLRGAARIAGEHPRRAGRLGVTAEEIAAWRQAADAMHLPYDEKRGVHQQCAGFTELQEWDFAGTGADEYPLLLNYPYFELYRRQVVKQADVVLAIHHCGDDFTFDQKAANFAYYERRTVRDSSLSAPSQGVLAAELGHLDLAHAYLGEAALHDLHDLGDKTADGLHIAALAGAWTTLVRGFGGLRDQGGSLRFAPRLPAALTRLRFGLLWRGQRLRVTITENAAEYLLRDDTGDQPVEVHHHGETVRLSPGVARVLPIPAPPDPGPEPAPPPHRAPAARRRE